MALRPQTCWFHCFFKSCGRGTPAGGTTAFVPAALEVATLVDTETEEDEARGIRPAKLFTVVSIKFTAAVIRRKTPGRRCEPPATGPANSGLSPESNFRSSAECPGSGCDLPALTQMALNLTALAATLQTGKQLSPAESLAIQNVVGEASKDLTLLQSLYNQYKAASATLIHCALQPVAINEMPNTRASTILLIEFVFMSASLL
jgi:hypothetical protein